MAPLNTVMQWLDTSADGLSTSEASARLCRVGPNWVRIHQVSALAVLKRQLNNAALGAAGGHGGALTVPKPYPREFRDDVVRVARNRGDGVTIEQIACDFGVHSMMLSKWMRQADIDDGTKSGSTTVTARELRELRRRSRLLELRTRCYGRRRPICRSPICRERALPARERACRRRDPRRGDVPGAQARPPALLPVAG